MASSSKCPPELLDSWPLYEKTVAGKDEWEWLGRGFKSRIALSTTMRFAPERAHSPKAGRSLAQSSMPATKHRSALWGSRVSSSESWYSPFRSSLEILQKSSRLPYKLAVSWETCMCVHLVIFSSPEVPCVRGGLVVSICAWQTPR